MRGEYFCISYARAASAGSPPLARGIPFSRAEKGHSLGSPPLARGIQYGVQYEEPVIRITPACAGNTTEKPLMYWSLWDHPRLCGEYSAILSRSPWIVGSPPLTRGILFDTFLTCCLSRDHPRLRGEYLAISIILEVILGSPPLTRGIPAPTPSAGYHSGITPAYAGNTRHDLFGLQFRRDHPRLRGEYRSSGVAFCDRRGSPPLTRGIPNDADPNFPVYGITPAYAGNTKYF